MPAAELYGTIRCIKGVGDAVMLLSIKPDVSSLARALRLAVLCLLLAMPVVPQPLPVSEYRLGNGVRVILAPRPGCGAIHAAWHTTFGHGDIGALAGNRQGMADLIAAVWSLNPVNLGSIAGAPGHWVRASSYGVCYGRDITAESLEDWCRVELVRYRRAINQDDADRAIDFLRQQWRTPDPIAELCTLALNWNDNSANDPLAALEQKNISSIAGASVNDIQTLADRLGHPGRITIVLVGDVDEPTSRAALEASFGLLKPAHDAEAEVAKMELAPVGAFASTGGETVDEATAPPADGRRIEIASETGSEVLVAWPIPRQSQISAPMLNLFAEILAGSPDTGLSKYLVAELGCSSYVQASVHLLADGATNLFIIRADVADGHLPEEVERAICRTVQGLAGGLGYIEMRRAIHRMDTKHARRLADASGLAQELLGALETTGHLAQALRRASDDLSPDPDGLSSLLEPILQPDLSLSAWVSYDPIRNPRSLQHAHLVALLRQMLEKRGRGLSEMDRVIAETLRQFGQMPDEARALLLALLENESEAEP